MLVKHTDDVKQLVRKAFSREKYESRVIIEL